MRNSLKQHKAILTSINVDTLDWFTAEALEMEVSRITLIRAALEIYMEENKKESTNGGCNNCCCSDVKEKP